MDQEQHIVSCLVKNNEIEFAEEYIKRHNYNCKLIITFLIKILSIRDIDFFYEKKFKYNEYLDQSDINDLGNKL